MSKADQEQASELAQICRELLTRDPAGEAIDYRGRWHDWGDVQRVAKEVQQALDECGAGARAPVSLVPRNRPAALAAFPALLAENRSVRMIYAFQKPAALARSIARLDSPVAIMDAADFTEEVIALLAEQEMAGIALDGMSARLVPGLEKARPRPVPSGEPQVEVLTSGTTGPPKQFPIPYSVVAKFARRQGITLQQDEQNPPFLMSFPIGNISGLYSVAAAFLNGGRIELLDKFTVDAWRDYIVRYRPAHGGAPPAAVAMILDANIPQEDLASLKFFSTGAAPLDPVVQKAFEQRYGIPVILSYGATEFGGPVISMTPQLRAEFGDAKHGSVGRAMDGVQLRLRDPETGELCDPPAEGLLEVVSPRMGEEWISTSDLVEIDTDGFVYCRGRADGAIMRGGFKILPESVEHVLLLHPAISAASVVGVADARLHEVPAAAIETAPGAEAPDEQALAAHVREHLPATHVPARWKLVSELPKTVSFKIDRPAVKRLFEDEEADS